MIQLVYVSSAVSRFDDGSLMKLLDVSRRNNEAVGITGLLLYRDGNFMQVIEGEREVVLALHRRIEADLRHHGLITMISQEIAQRDFSQWSMGFRNMTDPALEQMPGFSDFLNIDFAELGASQNTSKANRLLDVFRAGLR